MKGVLKEAGYAALKVCHQVYHCLETDSMAAIHGDDIIAEGKPEKMDRLDEGLKQLIVVKVLDRVGPRAAEHGQDLKRHIVYINGQRFECLEHPKHLAAITRNRSKMGDPEAFDELEEVEGKLYQQDAGISIYLCSGRFDIQFCVKKLSEMMTKPRKLGSLRLARLARYLVGTEKLVLRFDHQEYGDTLRIAVDSVGLEARNAIPRTQGWNSIDVETDSTAATGMCSRTDVGKNHQHRRRNGLDGCDRDVLPIGRWKDQTHPCSMAVDPRRQS